MAGSGFRGMSSVLLVMALAATAGFLYWVYDQAQSLDRTVTPRMADTTSTEGSGEVTVEGLALNPGQVVGRDATFDSLEVASTLGRGVFTVALNDTTEFPVLMASDLIQRGATVYGGDRVNVAGRVYTFNDSIRSEWAERGAVDSESVDQVPATPAFLLAQEMTILQ